MAGRTDLVRMSLTRILLAPSTLLLASVLLAGAVSPLVRAAQNPDEMLPAESAAKAQGVLAQAVNALGGSAYLTVKNSNCEGRYAQFEHSGDLGGFLRVHLYKGMPDKYRVEYDSKATIVDLYVGNEGWSLDKGGVSALPADAVEDYHERLETDVDTILRYRLKDPALTFRYAGIDVVDLMQVEWVEMVDHQGHTIRIAFNQKRLPVRTVVIERDPQYHQLVQRSTTYASYHLIDGIQTPFQVVRFRGDQQTAQFFFGSCQYNTALPPDFFARASLDAHFAQHGKKK